jgi:hypothetical protein
MPMLDAYIPEGENLRVAAGEQTPADYAQCENGSFDVREDSRRR